MDAAAAATSFRAILDKPLRLLTEEDISQLTREDCRKFLKDKGMRRPSWNKSQAIQQVISLKALLEVSDDSGAVALRKALVTARPPENPVRENSNSTDSLKELSSGPQVSVSADDTVPCRPSDPPKPTLPVDAELGSGPAAEAENKDTSPRGACAINGMDGQMTIFYCGKVNVYDAVPPDKARTIMHIAANPVHLPQDDPIIRAASLWSFPCHLHPACDKPGPTPASVTISQTMPTEKIADYPRQYREKGIITRDPVPDVEGQASRKVSLQRYFEKRKDRGRFKNRKDTGFTSPSLQMYLNNQVRIPISNGQLSRSNTSSPTQPTLSYALCSSADYQGKTGLNVDLNDKAVVKKEAMDDAALPLHGMGGLRRKSWVTDHI